MISSLRQTRKFITNKLVWPFLLIVIPSFAFSATYPLPKNGDDVIGKVYTVRASSNDTLGSLGLRHGMSLHEMIQANPGIDENEYLTDKQEIIIPAQFILPPYRNGIVVNISSLRLFYFPPPGKYVMTFPVGLGREEKRTPVLKSVIIYKQRSPTLWLTQETRDNALRDYKILLPLTVPSGPENPLGYFALHMATPGYLIHGNNAPSTIGTYVSSGCVRMKNSDIETLYQLVAPLTPVYFIHHPYMAGWSNGNLYLKAQMPMELSDGPSELNEVSYKHVIAKATKNRKTNIDWVTAARTAKQQTGIPQIIGHDERD
jgi:L,D-transpeptidase ErfK/SrfK